MKSFLSLLLLLIIPFSSSLSQETPSQPENAPPPLQPDSLNFFPSSLDRSTEISLKTTDTMKAEIKYLVAAMEKIHFNKTPLSKLDVDTFIKRFASNLDLNRLFFTQTEIDQYITRFDKTMLTYLQQGNLFPAFEIFKGYIKNFNARIQWIHKRLDQPFNFQENESFQPIRKDLPWPSSVIEANTFWNQRLKYEILNEMLSEETVEDDKETNSKQKEEKDTKPKKKLTNEEITQNAIQVVKKRYLNIQDTINKIDASDIQEIFLSTFTQMYDPHSSFLSAESMEDYSVALHNSRLIGIGATLIIEDGFLTIRDIIPGGPASKEGQLKPKDQIVGVGQGESGKIVDIIGFKLRQSINLIRGEENTYVRLLIKPAGEDPTSRKIIKILREPIKVASNLAEAKLYEINNNNTKNLIGLIDIPSFYGPSSADSKEPATTSDVQELIEKLKKLGMSGLILDLRTNGGGLLDQAISLTGLFIPIGPVVNVQDSKGNIHEYIDTNPSMTWNGPLILLISKYSASASEIFAGALKSYHRALIVGDTSTHGKGTVQVLSEIPKPLLLYTQNTKMGGTKLTVQKWYLPDGSSTQLKGVSSDISIPSINEFLKISEADLDNPLPWDTITTIPWTYEKLSDYANVTTPDLIQKLNTLSQQRQQTLPEFLFLKENIDFFKNKQEIKSFSLNLKERQAKQKLDLDFRKSMEARLKALAKNQYPATDVTLDYLKEDQSNNKSTPTTPTPTPEQDTLKQSFSGIDASDKNLPTLDIYIRESLRIMSDYLQLDSANIKDKKLSLDLPNFQHSHLISTLN